MIQNNDCMHLSMSYVKDTFVIMITAYSKLCNATIIRILSGSFIGESQLDKA